MTSTKPESLSFMDRINAIFGKKMIISELMLVGLMLAEGLSYGLIRAGVLSTSAIAQLPLPLTLAFVAGYLGAFFGREMSEAYTAIATKKSWGTILLEVVQAIGSLIVATAAPILLLYLQLALIEGQQDLLILYSYKAVMHLDKFNVQVHMAIAAAYMHIMLLLMIGIGNMKIIGEKSKNKEKSSDKKDKSKSEKPSADEARETRIKTIINRTWNKVGQDFLDTKQYTALYHDEASFKKELDEVLNNVSNPVLEQMEKALNRNDPARTKGLATAILKKHSPTFSVTGNLSMASLAEGQKALKNS